MNDVRKRIEEANNKAAGIMMEAEPILMDIQKAVDVIPGMNENMVLHSGPPVTWDRMSGPQKEGIIGAVLHEKLAADPADAAKRVERGEILIEPCHEHSSVGSMAGITSASFPVFVVKNKIHGNYAYHQVFFDGPGRQASRLTMGVYNEEVEQALQWRRDVLAPALRAAIHAAGGINLRNIIARALNMGDECHNRFVAGTYRFTMEVVPYMLRAGVSEGTVARFVEASTENEQFFLFLGMPACKAIADAAHNIPYSTVVTCMARNGTNTGIRVSGLGDKWFTAPSPPVQGLYFSSKYGQEDACPDMGDSTITETVGLGGFTLANSPAFMEMVGGTVNDALDYTRQMYEITVARNKNFLLPFLNFQGSPLGIDIRKVVEKGITPICDTGIAGRKGGFIGVGISRQPIEMFKTALKDFAEKMG
jgi:hypothetical protein